MIRVEQPVHHNLSMRFDSRTVEFIDVEDGNDNIFISLKQLSRSVNVRVNDIKTTINNNIDEFRETLIIKLSRTIKGTSIQNKTDSIGWIQFSNENLNKIPSVNILINEEGFYSYCFLSRTEQAKQFRIKVRKFLKYYRLGKLKALARHDQKQPTQIAIIEKMVSQFKIHEQKLILQEHRTDRLEETVESYQGSTDYKFNYILKIVERTPINEFDKSVIQRKIKRIAELMSGDSDPSSYFKGIWYKFNEAHGTNSYHQLQRIQLPHAIYWLDSSIKELEKQNGGSP